jgi:hypothetical protein
MNAEERQSAESAALARLILADEKWFQDLPSACKDDLSQPNHDRHLAQLGLRLAALVVTEMEEAHSDR